MRPWLVGESGCGKTTVGRTILRLQSRTAGSPVRRQERPRCQPCREKTASPTDADGLPRPACVPEWRFTVEDLIGEGLDIHGLCRSAAERRDRVYELLEMVGLDREHAGRFPHEFSGGQRQRVGIARALAVNPEFVVCDEPISALDVSIQAQVVNLLMRLQRELLLTYLFIAHDLTMVRHISDQVVVMYLGTVAECGATAEVYANPIHPYTRGCSAVPVADPRYERTSQVMLQGEVPSPVNPKLMLPDPRKWRATSAASPGRALWMWKRTFVACHRIGEYSLLSEARLLSGSVQTHAPTES